jgi:peptide/nickel transport system ATP-binding protein
MNGVGRTARSEGNVESLRPERRPHGPESKGERLSALLEVEDLRTYFYTRDGVVRALDGVSFSVERGETLAVVGESGCGKSVTALSILRLIASPPGRIVSGRVAFAGRNLLALSEREMRSVRGNEISMIFQEPMTSLNPVLTIGRQIAETARVHRGLSAGEAKQKAIEMLALVNIPEAERRVSQYPHELSGGMRQRVMIAMALTCGPRLLIADEPTTALDVTIQAQILMLMRDLKEKTGAAIVLITHDLGVVAEMAQRVVVMYAGRKVEEARVDALFARPLHPYTVGLLNSVPRLSDVQLGRVTRLAEIPGTVPSLRDEPVGCTFAPRCAYATDLCRGEYPPLEMKEEGHYAACWHSDLLGVTPPFSRVRSDPGLEVTPRINPGSDPTKPGADPMPLLQVSDLTKHFPVRQGVFSRVSAKVHAVDGVSFDIAEGETLGLVGESGCGKSTTGKLILKLIEPTRGSVRWRGEPIERLRAGEMRPVRRELQAVFQDPYSSLNPRMRAVDIVAEPIRNFEKVSKSEIHERVGALLDKVGLRRDQMVKYPYEFSGGQRQRLGIARALAPRPRLIVCDEPVSALDVSVQAQVINLLMDLQNELGISYLFVAHDLAVVEHISHRVAVMYLGKIVELTDKRSLFADPQHPYTEALLSAVPVPDPRVRRERVILPGDVPSPINPPSGCRFHTRCPYAFDRCKVEEPPLKAIRPGHLVACHLRNA